MEKGLINDIITTINDYNIDKECKIAKDFIYKFTNLKGSLGYTAPEIMNHFRIKIFNTLISFSERLPKSSKNTALISKLQHIWNEYNNNLK